jgi:putative membrane protein
MKGIVKIAGAVVFSLAFCLTVNADEKKLIEKKDREPANDKEFVTHAMACDVAAIKAADMALKTSKNEDVRKFATRLREDHQRCQDRLSKFAADWKLAVVQGVDAESREKMERLSKQEGSAFDREFVRCAIEGHEKALKMWDKWSRDAEDKDLREHAKEATAKLKEHLQMARELERKLKA